MARPRKKPALLDQLAAGGDRRLFVRKPLKCQVIFEDELGEPLLALESENLSLGGLFLHGDIPIRTGARTFLSFHLPTAPMPIRLVGEVVRLQSAGAPVHGMGIRFVEVPSDIRAQLEAWLTTA